MFDRPPYRFRHGGLFFDSADLDGRISRQQARHHVKTPLPSSSCFDWIGCQPGVGTATESPLLSFVDGFGRVCMPPAACSCAPALDLDEDEGRPMACDQIDLDAIGADVACDDAIPSRFEKMGGGCFACVSQFLSWIRHGPVLSHSRSDSLARQRATRMAGTVGELF